MEPEPMLTQREKFPPPEKSSSEENPRCCIMQDIEPNTSSEVDWTHNAASSRTTSPTHYKQAIPAPFLSFCPNCYWQQPATWDCDKLCFLHCHWQGNLWLCNGHRLFFCTNSVCLPLKPPKPFIACWHIAWPHSVPWAWNENALNICSSNCL